MSPTFEDGDILVLQQTPTIDPDQIIIVRAPEQWQYFGEERPVLVKRVAAIVGETLFFDGTSFWVADHEIFNTVENNYDCTRGLPGFSHTLDEYQVWVMGDNHHHSIDSLRIFCDGDFMDSFVHSSDVLNYGDVRLHW